MCDVALQTIRERGLVEHRTSATAANPKCRIHCRFGADALPNGL